MTVPKAYTELVDRYCGPQLPAGNCSHLLERGASRSPHAPAWTGMIDAGRSITLTYGQAQLLADKLAGYLRVELGLEPGDVVAIQLPNSVHFAVCLFGIWRAGLVTTCINPLYTADERRHQLQDSGAKALILLVPGEDPIDLAGCTDIEHVLTVTPAELDRVEGDRGGSLLRAIASADPLRARVSHWIAAYQYTGGTTGRSKGAILSHGNLLSAVTMFDDYMERIVDMPTGITVLTPIPLYHIFALVISFLRVVAREGHNVLMLSPRPLANLRPAFEAHRFDWMFGVETLYAGLLREPWFREIAPKVRIAVTGGAAMRPATGTAWAERIGLMIEGYGMTETAGIISINPPSPDAEIGTVGLPVPGLELQVRSPDGTVCGVDEPGELFVRGPNVCEGYRGQPAHDSWFGTGDIVTADRNGYIRIVDRLKDLIIVSGFNVYPTEVEEVLSRHPKVLDVAVVGQPDAATGERVIAHVATAGGEVIDSEELAAFCSSYLARYKLPREYRFTADLPKSAVGKVLRKHLR